jgi:hypothetical protein
MKNRRAQAWGIDLIVGVIIFSVGILIFFIYSVNQTSEVKENLEALSYQGDVIFNEILSEGYPEDWNYQNVVKIGILDNEKINETKLERFFNLTQTDYAKTRTLFYTKYHYYFLFDNITINSEQIKGMGKPGIDPENISSTNLIKITRFTIYKNKPKTVYLYIWEE